MARTYKAGVLITGDSKGAVKAVNLTEKEIENLNKTTTKSKKVHKDASKSITAGFSSMAITAAKWGAATAAAGIAATTALVKSGLSTVDALAKTSDKLGIATESLAKFRFAAEQTGVGTKTADIALQRFTRRLADAAAGTGPAVSAFNALGLSAKELVELKPDEAFAKIADKMNLVENSSQKVSLAFKLFDSEGVSLVNTLALGSEGLAAMAEEAEVLGLTLSRVDAAKVEQANDAMNRIGKAISGLGQHLAIKIAPLLTVVADRMFGIAKEAGGMGNVATKVFNAMIKGAGLVADSVRVIEVSWKLMKIGFLGAAKAIIEGLDKLFGTAIDWYNKLPWVDEVQYTADLQGFVLTWEEEINKGYQEVARIMNKPLPSDAIEEFNADVQRAYQETAMVAIESQGDIQGAVIETEQVTESLATTTKKTAIETVVAVKEIESAWDKALQDTVSRIDSAFSSAWQGAFDSFEDFASGMKDGFRQLIGELAHMLLTRPLIMNIGAAFGLGAGSTAASAAGGISGLSGGIGGIGSLLSGGAGSLMGSLGGISTGIGNYFGAGSTLGNAALSQGRTLQYGSLGQGLGNVGMNLGAGVLGGLAGNQLFGGGGYSNVGATIGGIGGSFFGPVGAAAGSFLGSGIGSLFGGNDNGQNAGASNFNLATGANVRDIWGNTSNPANADQSVALAGVLQQFADVLGGSSLAGNITVGDRSGIKYGGEKFGQDTDAFFEAAFADIIRAADDLEGPLKRIIRGFEGTAEQTMLFSAAVISLKDSAGLNTVTQAIEDFTAIQPSLISAYTDQTTTLQTLITNFDGSAFAADELAQALAINKIAAYEFSLAIQAIGAEIGLLASDQAAYIRESVMTADALRIARTAERDSLSEALDSLTDPEEVAANSKRILELNRQIFDSLSEDMQLTQAESFATFAENTNDVAQRVLEASLEGLKTTQEDINTRINAMLQDTAKQQQQAADTQQDAAADFGRWVNTLVRNGISVDVNLTGGGSPEVAF